MLKLFHIAAWLRAMTDIVKAGNWSSPKPPCVVRYHVWKAPTAMLGMLFGSESARLRSGSFGLEMLSESHAAARIRAHRPNTRGALLIRLIVIVLLRRLVRAVRS